MALEIVDKKQKDLSFLEIAHVSLRTELPNSLEEPIL